MKILVANRLDTASELVNAGVAPSCSSSLGNPNLQQAEMDFAALSNTRKSRPNQPRYHVDDITMEMFTRYPNQNSKDAIDSSSSGERS